MAGWLVLLAQSMVAAPLWAAAHAMPEGEGFAGERAKQGYMLLMNVAIRPILLVIGFVLAMGMVWASTWMSQQLMASALSSMVSSVDVRPFDSNEPFGLKQLTDMGALGNSITDILSLPSLLLSIIAVFLITTVVTIMLIHRSFDLIYETADDVMKWIGGSSGPLGGESQNTSKALGMIGMQFNRMENKILGGAMGAGNKSKTVAVPGGGNTPAADPAKKANTDGVANQTPPHSDGAGAGGGGDQGKKPKLSS